MNAGRGIVTLAMPCHTVSRTASSLQCANTRFRRGIRGVVRQLDLYQAGQSQLDERITVEYPLERITEAIASVERGEAVRYVTVM